MWVKSWTGLNRTLNHSIFNDHDLNHFMTQQFKPPKPPSDDESEMIWNAYHKLPFVVQKTDLWRYLIIYKLGGIYADIDVECRASFDKWFGPYDPTTVKFIVGLEVGYAKVNNLVVNLPLELRRERG